MSRYGHHIVEDVMTIRFDDPQSDIATGFATETLQDVRPLRAQRNEEPCERAAYATVVRRN
jgi:hypothetical protein